MIPLLRYHQSEMKVSLELCSPREALALKSVSVVMTEVLAFLLAFSWANYQLLQDAFFFGWWPSFSVFKVRNGCSSSSHASFLSSIFYCHISFDCNQERFSAFKDSSDLIGPLQSIQDNSPSQGPYPRCHLQRPFCCAR